MSHTPGPWKFYDDSNDGKTNRIEIVAIGKTVARIYHSVPAEDLPNARLIAAAPDLLEALKRLAAYGDVFAYRFNETNPFKQAIAAIEKAEGK